MINRPCWNSFHRLAACRGRQIGHPGDHFVDVCSLGQKMIGSPISGRCITSSRRLIHVIEGGRGQGSGSRDVPGWLWETNVERRDWFLWRQVQGGSRGQSVRSRADFQLCPIVIHGSSHTLSDILYMIANPSVLVGGCLLAPQTSPDLPKIQAPADLQGGGFPRATPPPTFKPASSFLLDWLFIWSLICYFTGISSLDPSGQMHLYQAHRPCL